MSQRILVIEDHVDLALGLRNNLEIEGYAVEVAADGIDGLDRAREHGPDLVILDLMLPGLDGFRVLRAIREEGLDLPILILTARGEESDKVRGLKLGADDYVTKPFGLLELLARVEALLRRNKAGQVAAVDELICFGDVEVQTGPRIITKAGQVVELTPKEFDLLLALWRHRGRVVSRADLLRSVWGYSDATISRTIDTHVGELRRKLEDDTAAPRHLLTVRKAGYRFEP